jgi:hypothetical protein
MVPGPMKIERQLNQRINSINLEPIRWYFRIVQYLLLRTEPGKRRPRSQCLCDGNLRFDFSRLESSYQ